MPPLIEKNTAKRGEIIKAELNFKTGELKFWQIKTAVDESLVRFTEEGESEKEK